MRGADHRSPDGPGNVAASLRLARHPGLADACAMVVIAGRVHAARDVTRVCAASVEAFESPALGPLGLVGAAGPVTLTRRPPRREHLPTPRIEPAVAHVAALLGTGAQAVEQAVAGGARGLVVETYAAGSVPPALGLALARAVEDGVAVAAASRARGLPVDDARPGGHGWLRERGVLLARGLAPEKARVRLALALGLGSPDGLRAAFAAPTPSSPRAPSSPPAASRSLPPAGPPVVRAPRPPSTR
jgi:L-asparaginase